MTGRTVEPHEGWRRDRGEAMTQGPEAKPAARSRWLTALGSLLAICALAYVGSRVLADLTGFGSRDAPITEAYVTDRDSTRLDVGVGTCNQDPQVTAVETADEVRLSSNEEFPRGDSDACADYDVVALIRPLGDRTVIDEATGDVVDVRHGDQS
jgi:hypothetical protein